MRKEQLEQIRTYLYRNLDKQLTRVRQENEKTLETVLKTTTNPLQKLYLKADTATKAYTKAIEDFNRINKEKGFYIYTPSLQPKPAVARTYVTSTYARLGKEDLRCDPFWYDRACEASHKIERFLLQVSLDADADTVEDFLAEILAEIKN
jgi:hypothetical protein